MNKLLCFTVLFALAGCASLTPTSVNPGLTTVTNTAMALVAASSGDCSVPVGMPDVAGACAGLAPATATVDQDRTAFEACLAASAASRLGNQAAAVKAAICAQAGVRMVPQPLVPAKP